MLGIYWVTQSKQWSRELMARQYISKACLILHSLFYNRIRVSPAQSIPCTFLDHGPWKYVTELSVLLCVCTLCIRTIESFRHSALSVSVACFVKYEPIHTGPSHFSALIYWMLGHFYKNRRWLLVILFSQQQPMFLHELFAFTPQGSTCFFL